MPPIPLSTLLSFPFKDPAWFKKLLILSLVILVSSAIPIFPLILVAGYMARLARRIARGEGGPALPEWDDLGGIFKDGWRPFAAAFTWMLPFIALMFGGWLFVMLPTVFLPQSQGGFEGGNLGFSELLFFASMLIGWGGMMLAGLLSVVAGIALPAALTHSAVKDQYAAAFRLKEWGHIFTQNLGGFVVAYLVTFGMSLVFTLLMQVLVITILLCWAVPILAIGFYSYLYVVSAALFGEAYRVGADKALWKKVQSAQVPAPLPDSTPAAAPAEPASPAVEAVPATPAKKTRKPAVKTSQEPVAPVEPASAGETLEQPSAVPAEVQPPADLPSDATLVQEAPVKPAPAPEDNASDATWIEPPADPPSSAPEQQG
jgi:hypothetical protein